MLAVAISSAARRLDTLQTAAKPRDAYTNAKPRLPNAHQRRLATPTAPRVRYLLRTDPWNNGEWSAAMTSGARLAASDVDDTPMALAPMISTTTVLARRLKHAWANANGALFFAPTPPCSGFFATDSCHIEQEDWRGCLAAYAADLNPGHDAATISFLSPGPSSNSVLAARWLNTSLYARPDLRVTVGVELFGDGRMTIIHEKVFATVADQTLVVGLRFDGNERVAATPDQLARSVLWRTSGEGAYAGAQPQSKSVITVCPVPEDWCVGSVSTSITLRAPFFGCAAEAAFAWTCAFVGTETVRTPASFAFENDGPVEVTCAAPTVEGQYAVELRYAAPLNDDDGGTGDGGEATPSLDERRLVFKSPITIDIGGDQDAACEWCGRDTCVSNICDQNNAFGGAFCDGSCSSFFQEDETGACCDVTATDCLGWCPTSSMPAFEGSLGNATVCCLPDCQGSCYGSARLDRCGVCEGRNGDEDACGACFGNATVDECPPEPEQDHRSKKRRRSGLGRSIKSHPWLAAFVAAELVATSLCLIICATQRGSQRTAGAPLDFGPTPYSRLARADLEALVDDHLAHPHVAPPDAPATVPVPRATPRASVLRRAYRRAFRSLRRRRALTEAAQAAPIARRRPRNADVVRRVAEAYEAAVADLAETAAPAPEAQAGEVCAICLDEFEDDDVVQLPDCRHLFHADCLQPWLRQRNTCPLCKQPAIARVFPKPPDARSRIRQSSLELRRATLTDTGRSLEALEHSADLTGS